MFKYEDFNPTIQKRAIEKDQAEDSTSSDESAPLIKTLPTIQVLPKWRQFLGAVTIEPIMFLQMVAANLVLVITQNLFIERICRVTLNLSDDACANFTSNVESDEIPDDIRVHIDGLASTFALYSGISQQATQVLVTLLLGSWCSKYGYKIPLLVPILGQALAASLNLMFTFLPDLPPEYLLISSIPTALSGGMAAIILSSFSYMAAITTLENRSYRIAFMEASWFLGTPVGIILGARIYKGWGFRGVYITSAVANMSAFIYGLLFMRDKRMKFGKLTSCCKDLFNVHGVKTTFQAAFKKRDGLRRAWILVLILSVSLRLGSMSGPANCLFLFTRRMFQWNEQHYSTFTMMEGVSVVLGAVVMTIVCIKIWKLPDSLVGILSSAGLLVGNLAVAFAPKNPAYDWIMYSLIPIQMFSMMPTVMIRSMLSKIVPRQELEYIFTLVACGETAMPMISSALYSMIFVLTEKTFPGAFSFLSFAFNSFVMFSFVYFFLLTMKNPQIISPADSEANISKVQPCK